MLIIGVTGQPSSGKDTFATYLVQKGFDHISTGDLIREEMKRKEFSTERSKIHEYVIAARRERGPAYLAEDAAKRIAGDTVVSGLRNTAEIDALRKIFGSQFVLVAVEAPLEVRYERTKSRNRVGDTIPFAQFVAEEEAERKGNPDAHQVDEVIKMADYTIQNSGTEAELEMNIDRLLSQLRGT